MTNSDDAKWGLFIRLAIAHLIEDARDAKLSRDREPTDFSQGVLHGYWRVMTALHNRALVTGVPLTDIGLDQVEPDRDLV